MKWYERFSVGQKVRVRRKTLTWNYGFPTSWNTYGYMDKTIGREYVILRIDKDIGFLLGTNKDVERNYWYPLESLTYNKGQQLLFDFMLKG